MSDEGARELAAQFCLSGVGGSITRVNGAIEILTRLLRDVHTTPLMSDVRIDWQAQYAAIKHADDMANDDPLAPCGFPVPRTGGTCMRGPGHPGACSLF